jgi:hypothetical protein
VVKENASQAFITALFGWLNPYPSNPYPAFPAFDIEDTNLMSREQNCDIPHARLVDFTTG